jgi:NAD+ kinase
MKTRPKPATPRRIGFAVNRGKPLAAKIVPRLVNWLHARGHMPVLSPATARAYKLKATEATPAAMVRRLDLLVALGGDGTLLRAARLVGHRDVPIMGVNLGGLGFLTEFSTGEALDGLMAFLAGKHTEERRMVLDCRYGDSHGFALNDVAFNMGPDNRVIEIAARADGVLVTSFIGDGLVVATPTGSTAYSLSAGGPVAYPTMDAILLTPLSPHALGARPLILPGDAQLELVLSHRTHSAVVNLDGQDRWIIRPGTPVKVGRARFAIRLVTPRGKTYFQILGDKLKWTGSRQ